MHHSIRKLILRTTELKWNRDRTNSQWERHIDHCVLCRIESQSLLKVHCMEGGKLKADYLRASDELRGI